MASLSAHLLDSHRQDSTSDIKPHFHSRETAYGGPVRRPPFLSTQNIQRTHDADASWMSGHGSTSVTHGPPRFTQWSEERIATLQSRLQKKLGPEYVTQRTGPSGGGKLSYIEGWKVINLANEVFGFNGWSSSIVQLTTDFIDVNKEGKVSVNVTAIVRITLQDGCHHEDVGCGQAENQPKKGTALDKAKKEAVTDATKRVLRSFGNVLGNCLYDKDYTKEVAKMRVPPAKLNPDDLERRPEFREARPGPSVQPAPPAAATDMVVAPHPLAGAGRDVRQGTPLRSVQELELEDDFYVDEHFDAEFAGLDMETSMDDVGTEAPQRLGGMGGNGSSWPPQPGKLNQNGYQHRERPDAVPNASTSKATPPVGRPQFSAPGPAFHTPPNGAVSRVTASSGNSNDTLMDREAAAKRQMGAPGIAGQSARAAAIRAAQHAVPTRVESPRIPAGGIDTVAARAVAHYKEAAIKLELHENAEPVSFTGFASARAIKRGVAEADNDVSPTKPSEAHGRPAGFLRRALGEITDFDDQTDWKRARVD